MHVISGMISNSVYRELPQVEQKKCLLIFPEAPIASYDLRAPTRGVLPCVTLKEARGTTMFEV